MRYFCGKCSSEHEMDTTPDEHRMLIQMVHRAGHSIREDGLVSIPCDACHRSKYASATLAMRVGDRYFDQRTGTMATWTQIDSGVVEITEDRMKTFAELRQQYLLRS